MLVFLFFSWAPSRSYVHSYYKSTLSSRKAGPTHIRNGLRSTCQWYKTDQTKKIRCNDIRQTKLKKLGANITCFINSYGYWYANLAYLHRLDFSIGNISIWIWVNYFLKFILAINSVILTMVVDVPTDDEVVWWHYQAQYVLVQFSRACGCCVHAWCIRRWAGILLDDILLNVFGCCRWLTIGHYISRR